MFEATADVSEVSAEEIITRDAKRYRCGGERTICIAQVEVVGQGCWSAATSCSRRCGTSASARNCALYALMVTDVLEHGTEMLVAGDVAAVARASVSRRRLDDRAARRDEPQEGGRAEAHDRAVGPSGGVTAGRRARASSGDGRGASPQSCSSR